MPNYRFLFALQKKEIHHFHYSSTLITWTQTASKTVLMPTLYNRFHPILGELIWLILHHIKAFDTDFMVSHWAFRVISHQQYNVPISQEERLWQCQSWLNSLFRLQLHFTPATRRVCDGVGVIRSRPFPVGWTTVCVFTVWMCVCVSQTCVLALCWE